jgi:hypothetical protein
MIDLHARHPQTTAKMGMLGALGIAGALVLISEPARAEPTATTAPPPTSAKAPDADAKDDADRDADDDAPDQASSAKTPEHASNATPTLPPGVTPTVLDAAGPAPSAEKPRAAEVDAAHADDGRMGTHQVHWLVGVGLREGFIAHPGFDPFSSNNLLPQLSLDVGRVVYASGPFSLAVLLGFDWGSTKASARGADTELDVARITAGVEGRYHFWRRFYAFGRIAPGALNSQATLKDPVAAVDREANDWAFASDFSVGAAVEFAGEARGASSRPRGFVGVDGGYGFAQSKKLVFESNSGGTAPARLEPLALGELAVRGGFFRVNGTITF